MAVIVLRSNVASCSIECFGTDIRSPQEGEAAAYCTVHTQWWWAINGEWNQIDVPPGSFRAAAAQELGISSAVI